MVMNDAKQRYEHLQNGMIFRSVNSKSFYWIHDARR